MMAHPACHFEWSALSRWSRLGNPWWRILKLAEEARLIHRSAPKYKIHTIKYLRVTRPRPNTKHKNNFCTQMTLNLINMPSNTQTFPLNHYQAPTKNAMIHREVEDGAVLQTWHCLPRANQSPCASTIPSVIVSITIPISHHHHHHNCDQRLCSHLKSVREL